MFIECLCVSAVFLMGLWYQRKPSSGTPNLQPQVAPAEFSGELWEPQYTTPVQVGVVSACQAAVREEATEEVCG